MRRTNTMKKTKSILIAEIWQAEEAVDNSSNGRQELSRRKKLARLKAQYDMLSASEQ